MLLVSMSFLAACMHAVYSNCAWLVHSATHQDPTSGYSNFSMMFAGAAPITSFNSISHIAVSSSYLVCMAASLQVARCCRLAGLLS
jgi:hypothetical protein